MREIHLQVLRRSSRRKAFKFLPGENHPDHAGSEALYPDDFG